MKVLWLCSWYPNKFFPFNGDFIKRHAEAASLFEEITVVHLVGDESGSITRDCLIEDSRTGNLREIIVYYYLPVKGSRLLAQLISARKYLKIYSKVIEEYIAIDGTPSLVHVHVGMNAGIMAQKLKKKYRIPYVVSEHWTGFLSEATDNFQKLSFVKQYLWRKTLKSAVACSMVSEYLKTSIQAEFPFLTGVVIKNVVNTDIFFPVKSKNDRPIFIHISTLSCFKQPGMILHAFKTVVSVYPEAKLEIFGPENKKVGRLITELNLHENVIMFEEVPQKKLADHIRKATALVLYSEYETFGCVIIEANACGVPVVVSDIPVFHETVREGVNGYFAAKGNIKNLAIKMLQAFDERDKVNKETIVELTRNQYCYKIIGKEISEWYASVIVKNNSF